MRDAPGECGPSKTLYNIWVHWNGKHVFAYMLGELACKDGWTDVLIIDGPFLKVHWATYILGLE